MNENVWEELLHQVGRKGRLRAVIDLTPSDATLVMVAMEAGTPYLGIASNTIHPQQLQQRLAQLVFQRFLVPHSSFCNPDLALLMSACELTPNPPDEAAPPLKKQVSGASPRESMVKLLVQGTVGDKGPPNREYVQVVDDD